MPYQEQRITEAEAAIDFIGPVYGPLKHLRVLDPAAVACQRATSRSLILALRTGSRRPSSNGAQLGPQSSPLAPWLEIPGSACSRTPLALAVFHLFCQLEHIRLVSQVLELESLFDNQCV
jgi:hypothetical protein